MDHSSSSSPPAGEDDFAFAVARCDCDEVLLEARFTGLARVRCRGCGARVWIACDRPGATAVVMTDHPEPRLKV